MELGFEMEDDTFFADITRRISLLITEDDEEDSRGGGADLYPPIQSSSSLYAHGLGLIQQAGWSAPAVPFFYDTMATAYRPSQSCKGTGVFIPKSSSLPRRKNRSGRSRHNKKMMKTVATATAATSTSSTAVSATKHL